MEKRLYEITDMDLLIEIYGTIMRNKLRTLLTSFSVAWGIFMLIVLLGSGNGLIHAFEGQSEGMMMNSMKIYPGVTSKPFQGMKEGRLISLNENDRKLTAQAFPTHIIATGATVSKSDAHLTYEKEAISIGLDGVFPNYPELEAVQLKKEDSLMSAICRKEGKWWLSTKRQKKHSFQKPTL